MNVFTCLKSIYYVPDSPTFYRGRARVNLESGPIINAKVYSVAFSPQSVGSMFCIETVWGLGIFKAKRVFSFIEYKVFQ